jgi:SAM-dependent methyltransferase
VDVLREFGQWSSRPTKEVRVLDLACGPARIAQHLVDDFGWLAACDVDQTAIAFVNKTWPKIDARTNETEPPLPFDDDSFDVVYCWSLLTHLAEDLQQLYLKDIRRLLRSDGIALVTTNGHSFLDQYHLYPRCEPFWKHITHERLQDEGMIFHEYQTLNRDRTSAFMGVTGSFGLSMHDPAYLRERWSTEFAVMDVGEAHCSNGQDMVVLQNA